MSTPRQRHNVRIAWRSDTGVKRIHNEDAVLVDEALHVLLLADGMGGHRSGEVASSIAVQEAHGFIRTYIDQTDHDRMLGLLEGAMQKAHDRLKQQVSSSKEPREMGTTLLAVAVRHGRAFVCNVGDSRAYVMNRSLKQITADHAIEDRFIGEILMADEPGGRRCYRILTQAVGASASIRPDQYVLPVSKGDIVLLCSDGLTDMLNDAAIEEIVAGHRADLNEAVQRLVSRANRKGGIDNISVILLELVDL